LLASSDVKPVRVFSREGALSCCLLIVTVWFGNFFEFTKFTLYSDDWVYLGRSFSNSHILTDWIDGVATYSDGRPLQLSLIDLTGAIMKWSGSLGLAYIFLFLITALSILATWWALTYRFSNAVALTAAAVLAVSPLVSVRPFLNDIAAPASMLFLMAAGILHVSGRTVLSYVVSVLILLSYELTFPLFVLLPMLLRPLRTRNDFFRSIGHALICAMLFGAYVIVKEHSSLRLDDAMAGRGALDIGFGILRATLRSVSRGVSGSIDLRLWLDRIGAASVAIAWSVLAFSASAYALRRVAPAGSGARSGGLTLTVQTIVILVLMILAGYALSYFADGEHGVLDRGSRFNGAANLPFSVLIAMALVGMIGIARRGWLRGAVIVVEASYLGILFGFSVSHQEEFAAQTTRTRLLVTQLAIDHPNMDPQATFIIQLPTGSMKYNLSIGYEDAHSYYFLLPDLFDFSGETEPGAGPAIRISMGDTWQRQLTFGPDGRLYWPPGVWPAAPERVGHIWCYDFSLDGELTPMQSPVLIGGQNILHEGPDAAEGMVDLGRVQRWPLFDKIMGPDGAIIDAIPRTVPLVRP